MSCHLVFFFNDTATTEIYTLSLHDALPISPALLPGEGLLFISPPFFAVYSSHHLMRETSFSPTSRVAARRVRSEEHTSELQSRQYLVCRLLLEKKKNK